MMDWKSVTQRPEVSNASATRDMDCPFCGQNLKVPHRAINTRCTKCTKHLRLEDVVVRGDSPLTRIVTCGMILVEPSARFSGTLQANTIIVAGRVMGTVVGTQKVQVTATGKVAGTIATRELTCDPAALVDGQINILNEDGSITTLATGQDHKPPKYRPGE
jgi:cytoskeletal protein CcmA (bactofilin family)